MSRREVEEILRTENEINEATKELKKPPENIKHKEVVSKEQREIEPEKPPTRNIKERKILSELPPLYPIADDISLQNKKQKQHQKLTSFNEFVGMMNHIYEKSKPNNNKSDEK